MSETTGEDVSFEEQRPMQIPPVFEVLLNRFKDDKKRLMKEKAFGETAEQLRTFVGTFMFPRIAEMVRLFAGAIGDTYSLAASNSEGLRNLHSFVVDELEHIRGELDDIDSGRGDVDPAVFDDFSQAFYALGTLLKEKLPGDEDAESAYNRCIELLGEVVEDLSGGRREDDDEDQDDGGDEPEAETEKSEVEKPKVEADDESPGGEQ